MELEIKIPEKGDGPHFRDALALYRWRRYNDEFGGCRFVAEEAAGQRREVCYSGTVQGVGFRYTVRGVASRFSVTGFVKNLPDGRVQLVAEGPADQLRRFLGAVDAEMGRYVSGRQETSGPTTGKFSSFEIRF